MKDETISVRATDSGDLLENPRAVTEAFCSRVGIPFIESALRWEPGADTADYSWWDGGSFHANLRDSDGLMPHLRHEVDLTDTAPRVHEAYAIVEPHYRHLHDHRLTVGS